MIHAHNKKLQTTPEIIFQQNEMLIDNKKALKKSPARSRNEEVG
jgi:hypothetical protein